MRLHPAPAAPARLLLQGLLCSLLPILLQLMVPIAGLDAQEVRSYRSNAIAMPLEELEGSSPSEAIASHEWVLQVIEETDPVARTERLYREGRLSTERRRSYYPDGGLRSLEEYDLGDDGQEELRVREEFNRRGLPVVLRRYVEGQEAERVEMEYRASRLIERRSYTDELRFTDRFLYTDSGRLRSVIRSFPDDTEERTYFRYDGDRLLEEWHEREGLATRIVYDDSNRVSVREDWRNEEMVERTEYSYGPDGELVAADTRESDSLLSTRESYRDGLVVQEELLSEDEVIQTTYFSYDDRDRLVLRREVTESSEAEFSFSYEGDRLVAEERRIDGELRTVLRFPSSSERVEERYQGGELFLRVYYLDETRLREEFIRDGEVVRERHFN